MFKLMSFSSMKLQVLSENCSQFSGRPGPPKPPNSTISGRQVSRSAGPPSTQPRYTVVGGKLFVGFRRAEGMGGDGAWVKFNLASVLGWLSARRGLETPFRSTLDRGPTLV